MNRKYHPKQSLVSKLITRLSLLTENTVLGILLVCFSIFLNIYLIPATISENVKGTLLDRGGGVWMSARFIPYLINTTLGILGFLLAIGDWIGRPEEKQTVKKKQEDMLSKQKLIRVFTVLIIVLCYIELMKIFGYLISSPLILATLLYYAGMRKISIIVAVSIGFPLSLYLFFSKVINVMFPEGVIFGGL